MIRGRYFSSKDEIQPIFDLRMQIFGQGQDAGDQMAMYAVAFDEEGMPSGAGRLYIDGDSCFRLDTLGVVESCRHQGMGDLMIRMLLQRALDLNAPAIHLTAREPWQQALFTRYGFEMQPDGDMQATPQTIERCYGCSGRCDHCSH